MRIDTFANRLQKALIMRNLRPIELAEKTKLDKSLISKYLSGVAEPKQDKIEMLATVLDINEVWLMGYDVPTQIEQNKNSNIDQLEQYKILFDKDDKLTQVQKEFILDTIREQHRKIDEEIEKGNVN